MVEPKVLILWKKSYPEPYKPKEKNPEDKLPGANKHQNN